jgi:hypothetical protein
MSEESYLANAHAALNSKEFEKDILAAALDCIDCFEPCGPQCACWDSFGAPPGFGFCSQDDEETSAMKAGGHSAWKIRMQELIA